MHELSIVIDLVALCEENLRKNNVIEKLKSLGIEEGQSVNIGGYEFEFFN